ncbi:MAG: hypothetical protein KatS3mg129_1134 [Leptospiraceae bacterium]|nr:MAG: hypothetical protein KatS3mg129_1134 [Leptospiraceae bacterium]
MTELSSISVIILVIFFPGIISVLLVDKLAVHSKWNNFKYTLYAFSGGILSYFFYEILCYTYKFFYYYIYTENTNKLKIPNLKIWDILLLGKHELNVNIVNEVFSASILSIFLGLIISYTLNHKLIFKFARYFNITRKYGDDSLFYYYLNLENMDWVYIRNIQDNLIYQGKIWAFYENNNFQEIVLYQVTVYRNSDSQELYKLPSIYLCAESGKFIIEKIPEEQFIDSK